MNAIILFTSLWRNGGAPDGASVDTVAAGTRLAEPADQTRIATPRPVPLAMARSSVVRSRALRNDGVLGLRWLR